MSGILFGRQLAAAAGAAAGQRNVLSSLLGAFSGGRDYRGAGGGTDYRVEEAQRRQQRLDEEKQQQDAAMAREQLQQAEATKRQEAAFQQQNALEALRNPIGSKPQSEEERLSEYEKRKQIDAKYAAPKPKSTAEKKYEDEKNAQSLDSTVNTLPVFSSMPFANRPAFSNEQQKERAVERRRQDAAGREAAKASKPMSPTQEAGQRELDKQDAEDQINNDPWLSRFMDPQNVIISERTRKQRNKDIDNMQQDIGAAQKQADRSTLSGAQREAMGTKAMAAQDRRKAQVRDAQVRAMTKASVDAQKEAADVLTDLGTQIQLHPEKRDQLVQQRTAELEKAHVRAELMVDNRNVIPTLNPEEAKAHLLDLLQQRKSGALAEDDFNDLYRRLVSHIASGAASAIPVSAEAP